MKRKSLKLATARLLLVLVSWLLAPTLRAEVGAIWEPGSGPAQTGPYEIGIIDDIDPTGRIWRQFAPEYTNRVVLNPEGEQNGDGKPSMLYNKFTRRPIVAWSKNVPGGHDVVVSQFVDGVWTPPQVIAGSAANELDPFLAMNPYDGSMHLLYWIHDLAPRVMYVEAPADLSSWSTPLQVSLPGEVACRPSAVFHAGVLRVTYESHGGSYGSTPKQIVLASRGGQAFTTESLSITHHGPSNWPQVHSGNGRLWVDWIDDEGEMSWRRQPPAGSWEPLAVEGYQTPEERDYHVRGSIKLQAIQD